MYKIIGSDANEYGPVSTDKIREWLRQGRVNGQTKVKSENASDWQRLDTVAEFAADLAPPPTGAAQPDAAPPPSEARRSKMAVASLVLGILGFFTGVTALVGMVLGIVAAVKISGSKGRLTGSGLATAGMVTSGVALLFVPIIAILAAMLIPALSQAKSKAQSIACMNNLKQLALGVRMYSSDNKDTFPVATNWCEVLAPYVGQSQATTSTQRSVFVCPSQPGQRCSYAYNQKLSGVEESKVDPQTVLIFESDAGWNAAGGPELASAHHQTKIVVAFADGHVESVPIARLPSLRWDPVPSATSQ
jgi:prepilin-type processing-associated H-X9-DG protein